MSDTKQQILDAAECLFSEHGIEAVPLRRIIAEAGVNSAAIHYHFGSKEGLVRAVFARRFDPINRERMDMLDTAETDSGDRPISVEAVLYAIVSPPFRADHGGEAGGTYRRLAGRLFTERAGYLEMIINDVFGEVERRFDAALTRALPELPEVDRSWRKYMAMGAMIFVLREQDWIRKASCGVCDADADVDGTIRRVVQFMAAGLRAPVRPKPSSVPGAEVAARLERSAQ